MLYEADLGELEGRESVLRYVLPIALGGGSARGSGGLWRGWSYLGLVYRNVQLRGLVWLAHIDEAGLGGGVIEAFYAARPAVSGGIGPRVEGRAAAQDDISRLTRETMLAYILFLYSRFAGHRGTHLPRCSPDDGTTLGRDQQHALQQNHVGRGRARRRNRTGVKEDGGSSTHSRGDARGKR